MKQVAMLCLEKLPNERWWGYLVSFNCRVNCLANAGKQVQKWNCLDYLSSPGSEFAYSTDKSAKPSSSPHLFKTNLECWKQHVWHVIFVPGGGKPGLWPQLVSQEGQLRVSSPTWDTGKEQQGPEAGDWWRGPGKKGQRARQDQYTCDDKCLIFPMKDFFVKLEHVLHFQIWWFGKRNHHIPQTCI